MTASCENAWESLKVSYSMPRSGPALTTKRGSIMTPPTYIGTWWRRVATTTALLLAALSVGTAAATTAAAEPNDGSGFDMNGYLACIAWNNEHGYSDDSGCCFQAGGHWYPSSGNKSAFCSPIVLSDDSSRPPPPPAPGATVILPPGSNTRAGLQ